MGGSAVFNQTRLSLLDRRGGGDGGGGERGWAAHMEAFEQSGVGLLWLLYTLQP